MKPNILLLTIDALRADRVHGGCMPCLDRLARDGIRFEQAITGGSWTQAAFPVLMTSTPASWYGGCMGGLSRSRPSPIGHLEAAGYCTGAIVTNPLIGREMAYDRGFADFIELEPRECDPWLRGVRGGQRLLGAPLFHALHALGGQPARPARVYAPATEVTRRVTSWIDRAERPFFLWAHYMDAHWPYHVEETLIRPREIAAAWRDLADFHEACWGGRHVSRHDLERYRGLYDQAIHYLDGQLGELLAHLGASGRLADTIVVVVADHGEEFHDHGRLAHLEVNLHDEIIRVPLILRVPGRSSGLRIGRMVGVIDLMPTLLELCGCDPLAGMQGSSFRSLWEARSPPYGSREVIAERWRPDSHIIAMRTERLKYIWDSQRPDRSLLFDLRADPAETRPLADWLADAEKMARRAAEHERTARETAATASDSAVADEKIARRLRGLGYLS